MISKMHINAHQFLIIRFLYEKKFIYLEHYLASTKSNKNISLDIKDLEEKGYINPILKTDGSYNFPKCILSYSAIQNFNGGDYYEKLYQKYPSKVYRTDGTPDYLRADRRKCEQLYSMIILNDTIKHNHILKCLDVEIKHRRATNSMGYMKRMSKWIASEEWKIYEDRASNEISANEEKEIGYGEEVE